MKNPKFRDEVILVAGARDQGKTTWIRRTIAGRRRVLIWDPKGEYESDLQVRSIADLADAVLAADADAAVLSLYPKSLDQFHQYCELARLWGRCTAVVDELASVTQPGRAPESWGRLIREGAHHQVKIIAATQRTAESDKTILGNCTSIVCFALKRYADRAAMAQEMDLPIEQLAALRPLQFIQRIGLAAPVSGALTFPRI